MVKIDNLVKRYGNVIALDHLNLNVKEGEIFGLLGPNGSGKTTLMRLILEGKKIRVVPKAKIGYLQQDLANLCQSDTVLESTIPPRWDHAGC